jgi:hypothetical protein
VLVTFRKLVEARTSSRETLRGQRTRVHGTAMALERGGLPHDLVQMIVEGAVGIDSGFWGSVAAGATFRSTGRKWTWPGRAVIAANRGSIAAAEGVVGRHLALWDSGRHLGRMSGWPDAPHHEHVNGDRPKWLDVPFDLQPIVVVV